MNTKRQIEEKVFSFIEQHQMLKAGDRIVAGVSGGADSVCLLFVLLEWAGRYPLSLAVVHVNHGIRREAGEDARFVEALCKKTELPFYLFEEDVPGTAAAEGCSEEEAGRMVRYRAFERAAQDFGADKIAVAHNMNDRAETMLFHLFRGSGIRGLGSIRPVRDRIIRPILCLERCEVEEYLGCLGAEFCRDFTNEQDDYTRNRIRHHMLPYVEKEIAPGCVGHMAQAAELLTDTEEYLEQQTREAMEQCVRGVREYRIDAERFLGQHRVIQQRILHRLALLLAPGGKDITFRHVEELMTLFTRESGRSICLPFGIVGRREYDEIVMSRKTALEEAFPAQQGISYRVTLPAARLFLESGDRLELEAFPREKGRADFPQNRYTKWLDCDKIKQELVFRTRQTGDYLTISGKDGQIVHKTVKDYMIDNKIPRAERDRIWLLAEGHHVVWLVGYRISEAYKTDENTKRILQVQFIGKGCDGSETEDKDGRTC